MVNRKLRNAIVNRVYNGTEYNDNFKYSFFYRDIETSVKFIVIFVMRSVER